MKKNIIFVTLFVAVVAFAAAITDDSLKLGKPGSSADKKIEFDVGDGASNPSIVVDNTNKDFDFNKAVNIAADLLKVGDGTAADQEVVFDIGAGSSNPRFKWDAASTSLQFANDGTSFKKIGSGAGASGINLLSDFNADFETGSPPSEWTASGGSFVSDTATEMFGLQSGVFDASAAAQTLSSGLHTIERGFIGQKCQGTIYYRYTGTGGDYKLQVVDQVPNVLAEIDIAATTGSNVGQVGVFYDCPTTATDQLRLRVVAVAADPVAITVDNAFVGTGKNDFQLSQSDLYAGVVYNNVAGCDVTTTSGTVAEVANDADCTSRSAVGNAQFVNNQFKMRVSKLPKGRYELSTMVPVYSDTSGTTCEFYVRATTGGMPVAYGAVGFITGLGSNPIGTMVNLPWNQATDVGQTDFHMEWRRTAGAGTCHMATASAGGATFSMSLKRYPQQTEGALNLETAGWFFDGSIGGAVVDLGTGTVASYATATNAGLDLVLHPGSVPGRIVCNANPSTGLTCAAGNEEMGVSVDIPSAGMYEACFQFSHYSNIGASSELITVFQVVRTADASGAIVEEGKSKTQHDIYNTGTNTVSGVPYTNCGTFNIPSAGRHAFRLYYEQLAAGTINASHVQLDRLGTHGQRDLHITIRPLNQQLPAPVFTDIRNKVDAGISNEFIGRLYVAPNCGTASCTVGGSNGNWFTSITRSAPGSYLLDYTGRFSAIPTCVFTGNQDANWWQNTTTINTFQFTTGTGLDGGFQILCMGPK